MILAGRLWLKAAVLSAAAMLAVPGLTAAQASNPPPTTVGPKLLVVLVVDQMRGEYIDKYQHQWTQGLLRLTKGGALYPAAHFPYLNTVTCSGHATIATGAFPATHGMILNAWWDRQENRAVSCTDDSEVHSIGYGSASDSRHSAERLLVPTLADHLRTKYGAESRIVTLSLKARSAVMLAGRQADAAAWFDSGEGTWQTSSAYTSEPVEFVKEFVSRHPVKSDFDRTWTHALKSRDYLNRDDAPGEKPPPGWTRYFPHRLRGSGRGLDAYFYQQWEMSPFSDAYLERLAERAVEELRLGQGPGVDFLGVSFSALDFVGHNFGPDSHEVQDVLVRLDETIGRFLRHLDRVVGQENYVVALSADHGVASIPEQMSKEGSDAGRVVMNDIVARVDKILKERRRMARAVARMFYTDLYFLSGVFEVICEDSELYREVVSSIESYPGVLRVFRGTELVDRRDDPDPLVRAAALSYRPERSGDLIVIPKRNWFFVSASRSSPPGAPATHGTLHDYDTRVPVLLFGRPVKPGVYNTAATPADIAPTLARLAGVEMPKADGRVLQEALFAPGEMRPAASPPPQP